MIDDRQARCRSSGGGSPGPHGQAVPELGHVIEDVIMSAISGNNQVGRCQSGGRPPC